MRKRNYIGLACTGHDNAIAIVDSSGNPKFAEAAERYLQNKRAWDAPADDARRIGKLVETYCEPDADIVMAKTWSSQAISILNSEREFAIREIEKSNNPVWKRRFRAYGHVMAFTERCVSKAGFNLTSYCNAAPNRSIESKSYDHHLTHAATGFYTSPFENAACMVIDGAGEGSAVNFFKYNNGRIEQINLPKKPGDGFASIGFFYGMTLVGLCGFSGWESEEWKVMGLAAYGELEPRLYESMKRYLQVDGLRLVYPETAEAAYLEMMEFGRKPGSAPESVANVAFTGQYYYEELVTALLNNFHEIAGSDNLVLGGGCALNSTYCGKAIEQTPFRQLHLYSAPADDGNALGAALLAYYEDNPEARHHPGFYTPYLGSTMSDEGLENLVRFSKLPKLRRCTDGQIHKKTAQLLADGRIIGWVQGRAEFGPRALGNRSILADPRSADMKEAINARIKFREEFRPFAPSVLHEFGDEYFENYQETPYMERTLTFRESVRIKVPAVVHADSSGRLQTVKEEWNPDYYRLIREFYNLTGVPIILNTSLNVMGKPIVHSVEDVIAQFFTSGLDALIIGNILIEK